MSSNLLTFTDSGIYANFDLTFDRITTKLILKIAYLGFWKP